MSLLARIAAAALAFRSNPENPSTNLAKAIDLLSDGIESSAGVKVSEDTAMRVTAVAACVRILSETIASLPLHIYERVNGGKQRVDEHSLKPLLHDEPNSQMSSFTLFETLQAHVATHGNAYAPIERSRAGRVFAIWPGDPREFMAALDRRRRLVYELSGDARDQWGPVLMPTELLHVPGLGYNGLHGYSPVAYHRETIGLAMATERSGAALFGNASRPSGMLTTDSPLDSEQQKRIGAAWEAAYRGVCNAGKTAVLFGGMKFQPITMTNEDAQYLETRKFQVSEIARMFRIPLWMIQQTENQTSWGTGIEQMGIGFVVYTLRPWLVRWERELNRKLFSGDERRRFFVEFNVDGLLRGDAKTRAEAYAQMIQWGIMNRNEARGLENMNPQDGLDDYLYPMNMQIVGAPVSEPKIPEA